MSLAEIKAAIGELSTEEQEELRRFLVVERLRSDPEWKAEMNRRIDEVKAGHYYTREDLERIRSERLANGG